MKYLNSLLEKIKEVDLENKIDLEKVEQAYNFSKKAHEGQFRKSGEEYIFHPVEVAKITLELQKDTSMIIAAILHDVVEDTEHTIEEIEEIFGKEVSGIVHGLTKLEKIDLSGTDAKVGTLRKMFIAMAKDLRVVFIKLSDRLHNLETIGVLSEEKQKRIAKETVDIYIPVAERLGIYKLKTPLEDLCFNILNKKKSDWIKNKIGEIGSEFIEVSEGKVRKIIKGENFKFFEISSRIKGNFSIYKKLEGKKVEDISEIYDIFAIRVVVDEIEDCYRVLGIIHKYYRSITNRFKDYISTPKPNGYRSLHTVIIGLGKEFDGEVRPVEIQIRTKEMHFEAEYGAASHWSYKDGLKTGVQSKFIKTLIDLESEIEDNDEFLHNIHSDILNERIFVLTPEGDIKDLPEGATVIDFAFLIHTNIGLTCIGASMDGKNIALSTKLKNGSTVKINTRQDAKPNPSWLTFVKTTKAKHEIKKWLSEQNKDLLLADGLKILNEYFVRLGKEKLDKSFSSLSFYNGGKITKTERGELIESVGKGSLSAIDVLKNLIGFEKISKNEELKLEESLGEDLNKNKGLNNELNEELNEENILENILENNGKDNSEADAEKNSKNNSDKNLENDLNKNLENISKNNSDKNGNGVYFKGGGGENCKLMDTCCNPKKGDKIFGYIGRGTEIGVHKKDCAFIKGAEHKRFIKGFWEGGAVEYSADLKIKFVGLARNAGLIFDLFNMDGVSISKVFYEDSLSQVSEDLMIGVDFTDLHNFSVLIEKINEIECVQDVFVENLRS